MGFSTDAKELSRLWNIVFYAIFPTSPSNLLAPKLHEFGGNPKLSIVITEYPRYWGQMILFANGKTEKDWPEGAAHLEKRIQGHLEEFFNYGSGLVVYWISCIGRHWRYGKYLAKEDGDLNEVKGERFIPLIDWQHSLHDDATYHHLCALAREIEQECETGKQARETESF